MPARTDTQHRGATVALSESGDDLGETELEMSEESIVQTKRTGPVINRNTVAKVPKTRAPAAKAAGPKKPAVRSKAQREALKDRTNIQDASETEDVEAFADEQEAVANLKPKAKKSRAAQVDVDQEAPPKKKARTTKAKLSAEDAPLVPKPSSGAPKPAQGRAEPWHIIPETQPLQDVSESIEMEPEQMEVDNAPKFRQAQRIVERARSVSQQRHTQYQVAPRARSTSQRPHQFSRGRSTSEIRMAESEAMRKLAEMTSQYEDMRLKYESLQELGRNGAETNFEKLKRASDQKAKDANELVASLKKELADLRKTTSTGTTENARMQSQVASLQAEHEKLQTDAKTTQASLIESQNEVKSLTAKLEAARKSAATVAEAAKVPGSAIKTRDLARGQFAGNMDATKQAALKEELYRDLTGLIINSIKRKEGEDEYSCIQTGRNGTLHFHLTVNNDSTTVNPKTPSGLSYEDTEFAYEPFFDEDRDRDLMDILPDYLTEDICFPRNHATKFYTKVVDSMTKRVVMEDE